MSVKKGYYTRYSTGRQFFGAWWPPEIIEQVDELRKDRYMSRGSFVLQTVIDHLNESKKYGQGATPGKQAPSQDSPL
jgi:hypothetical protein